MSPVEVVISHLPPLVRRGTSTFPVLVSAKTILSERKEPRTSPVVVFANTDAASHLLKVMSPVVATRSNLPSAITSLRVILPVVEFAARILQDIWFDCCG